jgi:hypothetical protein
VGVQTKKESVMNETQFDESVGSSTSRVIEGDTVQGVVEATSQASCPPGWHAVGGGFRSQANNDRLKTLNSVPSPVDQNGVARGWKVDVISPDGVFATAYAICVPD